MWEFMYSKESTKTGHPKDRMCAMNGFDANEPSRVGIICFLNSFNKYFWRLHRVPSPTWEGVGQI